MNIGEAARRAGVSSKTIRYYESIGLTPPPDRLGNGYRDYGESEVETLRFINRARRLGFSLKDIGNLLALWHDTNRSNAEVKKLARSHIETLDERIEELMAVRRVLQDLSERCHGDGRPNCPILEDLASGIAEVSSD